MAPEYLWVFPKNKDLLLCNKFISFSELNADTILLSNLPSAAPKDPHRSPLF